MPFVKSVFKKDKCDYTILRLEMQTIKFFRPGTGGFGSSYIICIGLQADEERISWLPMYFTQNS